MDRQTIIERLEDLRTHLWRGDTEALTEAIKALSLDTDKNQKEDRDMTGKVKVTIEIQAGGR